MQKTHSTNEVPTKERLEYWHSLVSNMFADQDFYFDNDDKEDFRARFSTQRAGPLDIFEINSTVPHCLHRTGEDNTNPAILLTLQLQGEAYISQDGRNDILKPGDFTLFDSSRQFDLQVRGPIMQYVVRLPRELVKQQLISPKRITGLSIHGTKGAGRIASTFIKSFINDAPHLDRVEAASLSNSFIDIVNCAALSTLEQSALSSSNYSAFQVHRIRLFIEDNLRNPDLSPCLIAAANGISQRYLNKLFEAEGMSIGRLLWERRLQKCRQDLADPRFAGKSITEIAYSWGFKSSSHFSRTFKDRFDISPRESRSVASIE